jgi:hypothetical protein
MLIEIPRGAEVIEMPSSTIWFDKEGILYSISKEAPPGGRSMEAIKSETERFRKIIGNKKVCIVLASNSGTVSPPREQRDAIAAELNSIAKAIAVVSASPLSRMVANLFFSFKPPAYPMKIFSNQQDARNWIRQFL